MANKTLTASVRLDTRSAEKSLDSLTKKIKKVETTITKVGSSTKLKTNIDKAVMSQEKLKQAVAKTALAEEKVRSQKERTRAITEKIKSATDRTVTSANRLKTSFSSANKSASGLLTTVKKLASAYLGVMTLKAAITTSDEITSAQNRLNSLQGGSPEATSQAMDKAYQAAQRSRSSYSGMLSNVSKSMTLAPDAFNNNIDNAIRFQEIMAKAYTVGGASAAEQSSSMYQLMQALSSGVLQGDELRSVREGAPIAYKEIEKFAQGVLNSTESLKELASQGKITSEIVVAAIMSAGEAIDSKFENTSMTFAQAWERIKNSAIKAFEPVSNTLNDALNKLAESGVFETIEIVFLNVGKAIQIVIRLIEFALTKIQEFFTWLSENWDWISKILLTAATILGGVLLGALILNLMTVGALIKKYILLGIQAVASAIKSAISWLTLCLPLTIIIAILMAIIIILIWVADSFEDACGIIVGVIMAAVAAIWNLIVGVVNAIIQHIWTWFVEPFIGIIEHILNTCNGGFNTFGDRVKNLVGNIISWFLSLGTVVTKIVDAILGTDWTGGLNSLKDKVLKWGKNENAITLSREAPEVLKRWDYGDAYDTGYEWGYSAGSWVTDKLSGLGDLFNLDNMGEKLGLDLGDQTLGTDIPLNYDSPEDIMANYNPKLNDDVGKIADNTDDISDSMDLTNEDLSYLRRIADMEWKKEYTTANITVDMSNYNTINGDSDLDGIVTKLADKLYDEMHSVANGVYV